MRDDWGNTRFFCHDCAREVTYEPCFYVRVDREGGRHYCVECNAARGEPKSAPVVKFKPQPVAIPADVQSPSVGACRRTTPMSKKTLEERGIYDGA